MGQLDIDAALRWFRFRPEKPLARRPDIELPFVGNDPGAGQALLLDTCVYIDGLKGRLNADVVQLIATRQANHSTVAIQELLFGIGALDPKDRRTPDAIAGVRSLIRTMQPHRVFTPDADLAGRAAMLAGLLCRLQSYSGDSRKRALMDAMIFLQAQKLGLMVLTANVGDFDLMLQLIPTGRVALYRGAEGGLKAR